MDKERSARERTRIPVEGVRSTASIAGHPLHVMMIPFPIAFLTGALVTDLAFRFTAVEFWARASFWLIAAGLVMGVLAAVLGMIDFATIERARVYRAGWLHAGFNAAAIVLALINLFIRLDDPAAAVVWWGLIFSAATAVFLAISGWYGGELSYRYKIGVIENGGK